MKTINTQHNKIPEFLCKTSPDASAPLSQKADPYQSLTAIYLLRLAIGLKNKLPQEALDVLFDPEKLGRITGLTIDDKVNLTDCNINDIHQQIKHQLEQILQTGMALDSPLFGNILNLGKQFKLSTCDQEILAFSLLMGHNRQFQIFIEDYCSSNKQASIQDYLQLITTRSHQEIENSIKPDSPLIRNGWMDLEIDLSRLITPPSLLYPLLNNHYTAAEVRKLFFQACKKSAFTVTDYPLLSNDLNVLTPFLKNAIQNQESGINILIFGTSTQGKYELARVIAKTLDVTLIEVASHDSAHISLEMEDRFAACLSTQNWLSEHAKSDIILMDDADDIFPQHAASKHQNNDDCPPPGIYPHLLSDQMSNNPLPIIWIVNNPANIDRAFLRRFDYGLYVEALPETLRHKEILKAIKGLAISPEWINKLKQRADVTIPQIKKATAIAKHAKASNDCNDETLVENIINSQSPLFNNQQNIFRRHHTVTGYDLQFTNTSIPLHDLVKGFKKHPHGTLCFYGVPGTGKTAFAKHLSEQLGLPLAIKRASDIFNKYHGETEKNIAKMFRTAKREGTILLLDEADSFLGDRKDNRYNWETSRVNELLTQMEDFEGIFICTTNLMERIDEAALRRFDFKVKFDYLTAEQRWNLFKQESARLGKPLTEEPETLMPIKHQIQHLTQLTPGDFAVLNRQAKFAEQALEIDQMLNILEQECIAKGEQFGRIGFVN